MYIARHVPQANGADCQCFDEAVFVSHADDIANRDKVFKQDENPGNNILHQFLGAEANRDSGNAGPVSRGMILIPSSERMISVDVVVRTKNNAF